MELQKTSTRLICQILVKKIFVDGGFARNPVYMHLLASAFPLFEVFSSHIAQASATGAAMSDTYTLEPPAYLLTLLNLNILNPESAALLLLK